MFFGGKKTEKFVRGNSNDLAIPQKKFRAFQACFQIGDSIILMEGFGEDGNILEPDSHPFINGCFNWMMVPKSLLIGNGWKSPFPSIHL